MDSSMRDAKVGDEVIIRNHYRKGQDRGVRRVVAERCPSDNGFWCTLSRAAGEPETDYLRCWYCAGHQRLEAAQREESEAQNEPAKG